MSNGFLCYYHHNDLSRQAVARCSKCGKALCKECSDTFRSVGDGSIECPDCYKVELSQTKSNFAAARNTVIKELVFIVLGYIVGLIIRNNLFQITSINSDNFILYMLPFFTASFVTLVNFLYSKSLGIITFFLLLAILSLISPIIMVIRIIKRIKNLVDLIMASKHIRELSGFANNYVRRAAQIVGVDYRARLIEEQAKSAAMEAEHEKLVQQYEQLQQNSQADETLKAEVEQLIAQYQADKAKHDAEIRALKEEQARSSAEQARTNERFNNNLGDINQTLNRIRTA